MLKIVMEFEFDEEQMRETFDNNEIKFTKKKVKELKEVLDEIHSDTQSELEERLEEIISEQVYAIFDK